MWIRMDVKPFSHPSPLTQEEMMRESCLTHLPLASPPYAGRLGKVEMFDAGTQAMSVHAYTPYMHTRQESCSCQEERERVCHSPFRLRSNPQTKSTPRAQRAVKRCLSTNPRVSLQAFFFLSPSLIHTAIHRTQRNRKASHVFWLNCKIIGPPITNFGLFML